MAMSRTNVDLDDRLINEALKLSRLRTKKEVLHFALSELVKRIKRKGILKFMGSGIWEGDLEKMRESRT